MSALEQGYIVCSKATTVDTRAQKKGPSRAKECGSSGMANTNLTRQKGNSYKKPKIKFKIVDHQGQGCVVVPRWPTQTKAGLKTGMQQSYNRRHKIAKIKPSRAKECVVVPGWPTQTKAGRKGIGCKNPK